MKLYLHEIMKQSHSNLYIDFFLGGDVPLELGMLCLGFRWTLQDLVCLLLTEGPVTNIGPHDLFWKTMLALILSSKKLLLSGWLNTN